MDGRPCSLSLYLVVLGGVYGFGVSGFGCVQRRNLITQQEFPKFQVLWATAKFMSGFWWQVRVAEEKSLRKSRPLPLESVRLLPVLGSKGFRI